MKILLVGEYSGFHNTLKTALQHLGHDVLLVGDGDQYKNYPVDISTKPTFFSENYLLRTFKNGIYKLFNLDLLKLEQGIRYHLIKHKLKHFDVVQLINSDALFTYPLLAKPVLRSIFENNTNVFLSACGDDTPYADWLLKSNNPYNLLTPITNGDASKKDYKFTLKYAESAYRRQFQFVAEHVKAIIPTDMDYAIALKDHPKVTKMIPVPIDISKLDAVPFPPTDIIHIFHGISDINYIKKGNRYFEDALEVIKEKYGDSIEITTARSLPYSDYIKAYDSAHILLDQVFSYDQGYNALEAMAKGKVVFTGAENAFYDFYELQDSVCINAKPDVDYLVEELSRLIDNPKELEAISENAKKFTLKHHELNAIAQTYFKLYIA